MIERTKQSIQGALLALALVAAGLIAGAGLLPQRAHAQSFFAAANYTGNGTTTSYSIPFAYLAASNLLVTINGTPTVAYTLPSASILTFTTAPANGSLISITRVTPIAVPSVVFHPGGLAATDLNTNESQDLFSVQEISDRLQHGIVGTSADFNLTLQPAATRANNILGFNGSGGITSYPISTFIGPTGPQGSTGATGATGSTGSTGLTGTSILNGTVAPTSQGNNGDYFLNTTTDCLYGPKASGTWPGSCVNLIGLTGTSFLNGTSTPSSGTGNNGDYFLNTTASCLYGPKAAGAWPGTCVSLIGPTGATGATGGVGPTGSTGAPGSTGSTGSTGATGSAGPAGTSIDTGTIAPTSGVGNNGDIYLNTTLSCLYAAKASGTWPGTCQSLIGPAGSGSGDMLRANNLSDVLSASTALGNLGGAPLASPSLTGTPAAPTATAGTSTTQLATTAFATTADNLKANLASPTFTGTPAAPTATAGTNTTQLATTAFVATSYAPLASPALTGSPTVPTATAGTNTTQAASTAFVVATYAPLASPALTGTPTVPTAAVATSTTQAASTAFVAGAINQAIFFQESLASGTTCPDTITASTWTTRSVNVLNVNGITGASLAASQITLPAGVYEYYGQTAVSGASSLYKIRVRDITGGVTLLVGPTSTSSGIFVGGQFTLAAAHAVAFQNYITGTSISCGGPLSSGEPEVYVTGYIKKIG